MLILFCLTLIPVSLTNAAAQSAGVGNTVYIKVYVSGVGNMGSLYSKITYDSECFDLLTYDVPIGTSFCNDTVAGEFVWAVMFDNFGTTDFTYKTNVLTITLIAKTNIDDTDALISNTVSEAYDAELKPVDFSNITTETVVEGEAVSEENTSSKTTFVISKYERDENAYLSKPESIPADESSSAAESTVSENKSGSENGSSGSPSEAADSETVSEISERSSQQQIISSNQDDISSQGNIDLSAESYTSAEASERGGDSSRTVTYIIGLIIGGAVIIVLAIIFTVLSRRNIDRNANHMK